MWISAVSCIVLLACLLAGCMAARRAHGGEPAMKPVAVEFTPEVTRLGRSGDNWCMTWAADSDLYTSMCDGSGWPDDNGEKRGFQNNRIYRIAGGPDAATLRATPLEDAPVYDGETQPRRYNEKKQRDDTWWVDPDTGAEVTSWNWYAYGIASVDGALYQFISHCADRRGWGWFDGCQLIWRPKGATRWLRWNGTDANDEDRWFAGQGGNQLLFHNEPDYAFSFITIAQFGQDYRDNKDGYVYLYSPNGRENAHRLNLARVKKKDILDRTKWEYFVQRTGDGNAEWAVDDLARRGDVHTFPEGWGWYSWSPSVVWNDPLGLFIMACAGTQRPGTGPVMDVFMHYETGGLMLLWAEHPWGPWRTFHWDEVWDGDNPANRLYMPQLSPKWITDDGTTMYLIYSDARDRHSTNYRWNMQQLHLVLEHE